MAVKIGEKYKFDYPKDFQSYPDYTDHAGQFVQVKRELQNIEAESGEINRIFEIRADDGWEGVAFEDELKK